MPYDFGGTFLSSATAEMQQRIADLLGLAGDPDPRFRHFDDRIQRYFDTDLRSITPARPARWGLRDVHDAPLRNASVEEMLAWPWPEPRDEMVTGLREEARFLREQTDYFVVAAQVGNGVFELGCWLRGYDQILLDLGTDSEFWHAFCRKVVEVNARLGELYFGEIGPYVDMVLIGDDLALQDGPFMSPAMFRRLVKPYFAEYVASIREQCPGAFIAHHCCGSSFRLLDDLAEIGVDVVNPVQTRAAEMAPENLATKKDRLSFHGGGDLQHILPHGTEEEVEEFAKHLIEHLAPGGGFILAPCHTLPEDVRPQNLVTLLESARRWGRYPIGSRQAEPPAAGPP